MSHERPTLKAENRDRIGSRYARRLRTAGKLPAVVYGHGQDPAHVAVDHDELIHALHTGAHLIELAAGSANEVCLIKDVQYDYLGTDIIHVDLTRVDPIVVHGEDDSPGLKAAGAFLSQHMVDIEVICRADSIPDEITVDISALDVDGSVSVADLTLPTGVKVETDADSLVLAIEIAKEEEEEGTTEGADGAEPEVLSEKKTEEEEDKYHRLPLPPKPYNTGQKQDPPTPCT